MSTTPRFSRGRFDAVRLSRAVARRCAVASSVALVLAASAPAARAQEDPATFFKNNCAACHTIGAGRLTGPDLKDVGSRRDRAWLTRFVSNPQKVIESGDPYALALQKESYGLVMPTLSALTPALIDGLLDYIDAESGGAAPAAEPQAARAFTGEDVAAGEAIFTGGRRLTSGGPSCISCHTVRGAGGLGGGRLAPDLTLAFERLQGRPGLTAWLGAPATPTMRSLFATQTLTEQEIDGLVAYLEQVAGRGGADTRAGATRFALFGLGGAAVGLVVMGSAWKNRFRSVRRALVARRTKRS